MITSTTSQGEVKKWRVIVFVALAALACLFYLTNLPFVLAPWLPMVGALYGASPQEMHQWQWHITIQGVASSFLICGCFLALLWRPREKPLLIQYLVVDLVLGILVEILFIGPFILLLALPAVLAIIAYPAPRAMLRVPKMASMSRLLLGLTILAVILLIPLMGRELLWQIQGVGGQQAATAQWSSDVEHTLYLLLAGLFASTKRPGWSILGLLTGVAFFFLGIAALSIPNQAGSWGTIGGIIGVIGGLSYLGVTLFEMRQACRVADAPASEVAQAPHA